MTSIEKTLIDLYAQFNTPVNQLPYTETLASITASFNTKQSNIFTAGMVWQKLADLRKSGRLPPIQYIKKIDPIDFAVAQQYKTIADQKIDNELVVFAKNNLVENVEAIMGGAHASGRWSSEGVIAVVKDAIKMMSKKES